MDLEKTKVIRHTLSLFLLGKNLCTYSWIIKRLVPSVKKKFPSRFWNCWNIIEFSITMDKELAWCMGVCDCYFAEGLNGECLCVTLKPQTQEYLKYKLWNRDVNWYLCCGFVKVDKNRFSGFSNVFLTWTSPCYITIKLSSPAARQVSV